MINTDDITVTDDVDLKDGNVQLTQRMIRHKLNGIRIQLSNIVR